MVDEMSTKELDRLAVWLKAHGHTSDEILDCLSFIAGTQKPVKSGK